MMFEKWGSCSGLYFWHPMHVTNAIIYNKNTCPSSFFQQNLTTTANQAMPNKIEAWMQQGGSKRQSLRYLVLTVESSGRQGL